MAYRVRVARTAGPSDGRPPGRAWRRGVSQRAWRRRGRRAQVSAIATLLGLLLVVTFIANYLANQLPGQMAINDQNRTVLVQNQLTRFSAQLQALGQYGKVGGTVTQPVALGSQGAPPFAPPDGGSIGQLPQATSVYAEYTLANGVTYNPPTVGSAGGYSGSCATHSTTTLTCGSGGVTWNFTAASASYSVTTTGGPYHIGFATSGSTIALTATSASPTYIVVIGNNDTMTVTVTGTSSLFRIDVIGNYDKITFSGGTWTSCHISLVLVGAHDTVVTGATTLTKSVLTASFYGTNDTFTLGTTTATASAVNTYFTGFQPAKASPTCPADNLALSTSTLTSGATTSGSGKYNATFNDSKAGTATVPSPWTGTFSTVTPAATNCAFYANTEIPVNARISFGGAFAVTLRNTYIPYAVVGFDQGAVAFGQSGGGPPLMVVGPAISYTSYNKALSVWLPEFSTSIGAVAGTGTPVLSARLVSVSTLSIPQTGFTLTGTTSITVTTPYAAAWLAYLNSPTSSVDGDAVCEPAHAAVCVGPFSTNGALGTLYLNVTASILSIDVATFGLSVS